MTPHHTTLRRSARALALVLVLALSACSTNPVTGRSELVLMSPEREAAVGREAAQQVAQQIGLVEDPQLSAYIDAIGQRLAKHSPRQDTSYQFAVADMPEPNAFALPGGYIYVSRGLLAIANSEGELANVIGHEIGHVAARHSAQRETRQMGVGLLTVLGTVAAAAYGGAEAAQAVGQLGQVAGAGLIASYGRDQERESDDVGQKLSAQSGWDPIDMARFLDTLDRESTRAAGGPRMPSFLDSHPVTRERVASARQRAATLSVVAAPPIAADRGAFLSRLENLAIGPDPAAGVFRDALFLHPGLDFAIEFPAGWTTQNSEAAVGAISPQQDAIVVLEPQGPRADPRQSARAFAEQNQLQLRDGRSLRIGGWDAYSAWTEVQTQQGAIGADFTWVDHPKGTFRITGRTAAQQLRANAGLFQRTASSLRALTQREHDSVTELRLRVATARRGESLDALSRRAQNAWSLEETAVANALDKDAALQSGQLVKIAVEVPFRP